MRILLDGRVGLIDAYVRGQFCEFLGGDGVAAREILFVAENSAGIAVIQNYPGLFWREAEPDELFQGCRVGIESEKRVAPGFPAFAGLGRFARMKKPFRRNYLKFLYVCLPAPNRVRGRCRA